MIFFVLYTFYLKRILRQQSIEKRLKIMFNRSNCDRKSQISGILTEPLNTVYNNLKNLNIRLQRYKKKTVWVFFYFYCYIFKNFKS